MIVYDFRCMVCDKETTMRLNASNNIRVGELCGLSAGETPDDFYCECGANNWKRIWGGKSATFKINMRGISI